jgi:hypothetical protein
MYHFLLFSGLLQFAVKARLTQVAARGGTAALAREQQQRKGGSGEGVDRA